jgi:hypothetical protein
MSVFGWPSSQNLGEVVLRRYLLYPISVAFNLALTSRCSRCTGIQCEGEHNQCVNVGQPPSISTLLMAELVHDDTHPKLYQL